MRGWRSLIAPSLVLVCSAAAPQQAGSIRGVIYDKDYDAPLAGAQVLIVETGKRVTASDRGAFVFPDVAPGRYTLVFSKDGYVRQVKADVLVADGRLTDIEMRLVGEFTEMEEFVVHDVVIVGSEAAMLKLRLESPSLLDNISADLMSRAGASDAGAALNLVAGATAQDGKYAVIRGLPDRYVSSQLNNVRLPTADEDKRAVQLDQFPAAVLESIRVSKTFTPDQQGDASGGAVNVVLKGIPDETSFSIKSQMGYNSQASGRSDFLTYNGGGLSYWGYDDAGRDIQSGEANGNWTGAAGVARGDSPVDYKWSMSGGGKFDLDEGVKVGGFASLFYERDSSFFDNGIDDSYWVVTPGSPMTPVTTQGPPSGGDFKTKLFDVTRGTQSVQWGALGTFGVETENHKINLSYLSTRIAEDSATLAEDTRGKAYFFPGFDPNDPMAVGNQSQNINAAPYTRLETLEYTERTTQTVILNGRHKLVLDDPANEDDSWFRAPELDWTVSMSGASLNQPDKRQFGSLWHAAAFNPGFPPFIPSSIDPATFFPFKPDANFTLGNFQRIWKRIDEDSEQYSINLKLPFEQWSGNQGYLKFGMFDDHVGRTFNQDTFSNFSDNSTYQANFDQFWSAVFPNQPHPISAGPPLVDVDYKGEQKISAWYAMADVPLSSSVSVVGGARFESTSIGIRNTAEPDATWFPPGAISAIALTPGAADVSFEQDDVLPSLGLIVKPLEDFTLRAAYSQTIARQTFKELTPIMQQEYLGGPIFIGNPGLQMSALKNYDFRLDYTPYEGALISASWFYKQVTDPIEYVQRVAGFTFTTPVNYPKGKLTGFEFEVRQNVGHLWEGLEGLNVGANATFIDSEVLLPADEVAGFNAPAIRAPMTSRRMTGAPEHLYNLYLTFDSEETGTQLGLFYTVTGDTLLVGAGESNGNFVPNVFALEYGTLNFTITQRIAEHVKLFFQAKNITNPAIETVYRSEFIGNDVLKTSYTKGVDLAVGLTVQFAF